MNEETTFTPNPDPDQPASPAPPAPPAQTDSSGPVAPSNKPTESHLFNVSVRAWIALIVIVTVCYMAISLIEVKEPLYSISLLTVGFFFGQATKPKTQTS